MVVIVNISYWVRGWSYWGQFGPVLYVISGQRVNNNNFLMSIEMLCQILWRPGSLMTGLWCSRGVVQCPSFHKQYTFQYPCHFSFHFARFLCTHSELEWFLTWEQFTPNECLLAAAGGASDPIWLHFEQLSCGHCYYRSWGVGLWSWSLAYLLNSVQDDCPTSQNKRERMNKMGKINQK